MCMGGGGTKKAKEPEFKNRPVIVTGKQRGVDKPKDTEKATERLKIKRQKEEGTYKDPNLTTADTLTRSGGKGFSGNRSAARDRAKNMARGRLSRKSMSGGRVGGRV